MPRLSLYKKNWPTDQFPIFFLKYYQSDHRSGFQFTCESSDELDTVLHHTGSWFCHGLKKYSTFLNVCALLPIHVNFLHLKFARVFTFTLCIELFLAYFVFTKLHEKHNITFLSVCFGLPFGWRYEGQGAGSKTECAGGHTCPQAHGD